MTDGSRREEQDLAFQEWVARARDVSTIDAAYQLGFQPLKRRGSLKKIGACTACGTSGSMKPAKSDRFCVFISGPKEGGFRCRKCGIHGGDAIALIMSSTGQTFLEAVEHLTGEAPPRGKDARSDAEKAAARARIAEARRLNEERRALAEAAQRAEEANRVRWAGDVWSRTRSPLGTEVEGYLRHRGIRTFDGLNLDHCGFAPAIKLKNDDGQPLHTGPAMIWQVVNPRGQMSAVHRTWIDPAQFGQSDPETGRPMKGRPRVVDPETGEALATKKTLGIKEGSAIRLDRGGSADLPPRRLFLAEGVETVGGVREALIAARHPLRERAAFWSACDLGNIAMIMLPGCFEDVFLLGDGDSDPATIEAAFQAHMRANARPGRRFVPVFARPGVDFSDMWMSV